MTDLNVIISEIELKLRKLILQKEDILSQKEELFSEKVEMQKELEALRQENAELKQKLNQTLIVNTLGNDKEIEEGRVLIRNLVREIDKSIAILSAEQ